MKKYAKIEKEEDILNSNNVEKIQLIERLIGVNTKLFDTLFLDFFNSDLFFKFDFDMLTYITTIENTQESLLKLSKKEQDLFIRLINTFSREYYYPPYFAALINSFDKKEYSDFIESLPEIDSLSEEELRNISLLITSKRNYLNIRSYEEFKNFDINQMTEESRNNVEDYKNIKLISTLNISLEEARIICSKYCYDIEKIECPEKQETIDLLRTIKSVVLSKSFEDIDSLLSKPYQKIEYPNLQTIIQQMYTTLYNKELYTVEGKEYKEQNGVKVYDAGLDFNMIVRSNGAFSSKSTKWNDNIRDNYSFSNSFISNGRLNYYGLQKSGLITLGFNNLNENAIVENSLGDNATIHRRRYTMDPRSYNDLNTTPNKITGDGCGQFFSTIESISNFATEAIHTEITLERFYTDENNNEVRIQPSYVVCYIYDQNYMNDPAYLSSLEAAKEFNIPVVTVDVKKVLENERTKINAEYNKCLTNASIEEIEKLFHLYANNYVNFKYISEEAKTVFQQFYQEGQFETMLDNIIKNCREQNKPQEFYQQLFNKLMIINAPKRLISNEYLFNLHKEFNLNVDTIELTKELEGILPFGEIQKSEFYEFDSMLKVEKICNMYNITPTTEILKTPLWQIENVLTVLAKYDIPVNAETIVMDGYRISSNIRECEKRDIPWTMEILKIRDLKLLREYLDSLIPKKEEPQPEPVFDENNPWDGWENDDWANDDWGTDISEGQSVKFI